MIRIVIADDHKLFRETLGQVISHDPSCQVIALCAGSDEVMEIVPVEKPDIVLMDINIAPFSGIETTQKLSQIGQSGIIGLSMHTNAEYAKNMIKAGARGYVTKNSPKDEIFTAMKTVMEGKKYICNEVKNIIADNIINEPADKPPATLTSREAQIINFIREGLSSKEIAAALNISLKTVEVHRHNMLKKLQLKNAASLVNFVYTNGGCF